jgi:hypothetical protein
MRSLVRTVCLAGVVCAVALPAWAADGVLIVQKVIRAGGEAKTNQIQIEQHRMRAEIAGPGGASQSMVFDGGRQVMTIIDNDHKTYSEITQADVDAISQQMSSAMAQMQAAAKNMTPEQRAQMEALMGRAGAAGRAMAGAASTSKTVYRKTGTDTVGKWTCDKYEGTKDGQKVQDLCTVDPKALGFTIADFAVSKDMAAFFQKMMPPGMTQAVSASELFHIGTPEEQGFSGVPVRTITYAGGQASATYELSDVRRQSFTDATFQAPAGYQKTDSPLGRMGRRGRQ